MKSPNCALFSVNDASATWPDFCIRFDACTKVVVFSKAENNSPLLHITPAMAKELIDILSFGLELVFQEEEGKTPPALDIPLNPDPAFEIKPEPLKEKIPEDWHVEDHTQGCLIRHEYKDLYFSSDDRDQDRRECTGKKDDAVVFPTRYAAVRFTQGMKHSNTIITVPSAYVISWKETPHAKAMYYSSLCSTGTLRRDRATRLTRKEAIDLVNNANPSLLYTTEKVQA